MPSRVIFAVALGCLVLGLLLLLSRGVRASPWELMLLAASAFFLVAGILIVAREQQADRVRIAELTSALDTANHQAVREPAPRIAKVETVAMPVEQQSGNSSIPANPLDNPPLLHFVEDISRFCDDLTRDAALFDGERREISDHVLAKLYEAMERVPGVAVVSPLSGEPFDRTYHKAACRDVPAGATIGNVQSPGILIGERVVRPALVTLE